MAGEIVATITEQFGKIDVYVQEEECQTEHRQRTLSTITLH